jgi:hypothetical protein
MRTPALPPARTVLLVVALAAGGCGGADEPAPSPSSGGAPGGGVTSLLVSAPAGHLPASVLTGRSMEARALDVDSDGDLDLVVAREASPNVLLLNDGSGRFTDASAQRIPQAVRDGEDIAAADFDRDGDVDLVIVSEDQFGSAAAPKHAYYLNAGGGTFTDASARIPGRAVSNAVAAADIDGDGDVDLVLGNNGPESVLVNDGAGGFADESFRVPAVADVTQDVLLADVDRDGDPDLVVANEEAGPNRLLMNDGRGVFALAPDAIPLRVQPEATRNADLGDVDGDGDLDLMFANVVVAGSSPQSRLLLNDGAGRFADATADRLPVMTAASMDAEFVDLDRDGDLDIVTAPFPANLYRAFVNDGAGRFTDATATVFPAGLSGQAIEVEPGDFNRDGRVDLYVATYIESADLLLLAR